MKSSNIEANKKMKTDNSDIKSVGRMSSEIQPPSLSNYRDGNQISVDLNYNKNRAQSLQNFREGYTSTSEKPLGNAIKQGLSTFIKGSNIDLDELSNNLSQRQNSRRSANSYTGGAKAGNKSKSRSISDQSGRKGANQSIIKQGGGPGLPLPKNAYKRLAQTYAREAAARKNKALGVVELMETPESKNRKELPRPVEQPQILSNQNEQTFENVRRFIGDGSPQRTTGQRASGGVHDQSPNFFDPDVQSDQHQRVGGDGSHTRNNKFQIDFEHLTRSEQRKRFNSFCQGQSTEKERAPLDITAAPVGTIVRVSRNKAVKQTNQNYSTFGGGKINSKGQTVQSMSPLKFPNDHERNHGQQQFQQFRPPPSLVNQRQPIRYSYISDKADSGNHRPRSNVGAGKIVRQSDIVSKISNQSPQVLLNQSQSFVQQSTLEPSNNISIINQAKVQVEPFAEIVVENKPIPFVQHQFYIDPTPFSCIWDCFEYSHADLLEMTEGIEVQFQEIRDDVYLSINQFDPANITLDQFKLVQSLTLAKIRQAIKILSKERLLQMLTELSEMKHKLNERKESCRQNLINSLKLQKEGKSQGSMVCMMKHEILRDICSRLRQKVTIYALQLSMYHRQESQILFEELFHNIFKNLQTTFAMHQFKQHVVYKRGKRDRAAYICQVIQDNKMGLIVNFWRNLRSSRILRERRLKQLLKETQMGKMHKLFLAFKSIVDHKALKTLDDEVIRLHRLNKYRHKIFVYWRQSHLKDMLIKRQAISIVTNKKEERKAYNKPFTQDVFQRRVDDVKNALLCDKAFNKYQTLRKLRLKMIQFGQIKLQKITGQLTNESQAMLQESTKLISAVANINMPLKLTQVQRQIRQVSDYQPSFKSLIKNQNPEAYKQTSVQGAMDLKYDIHSLLVDTQNYFYEQRSQNTQQVYNNNTHEATLFLPFQQQTTDRTQVNRAPNSLMPNYYLQPRKIESAEDSQVVTKAPNQFFQQILNKNQQQLSKKRPDIQMNNLPSMLEEHIFALKETVLATISKIIQLRNQDDYTKHYSFAVKFLIKEEQQLQTYRMTQLDQDTITQTVTYVNTRRSTNGNNRATIGGNGDQTRTSYIESSPGIDLPRSEQRNSQHHNIPLMSNQNDTYFPGDQGVDEPFIQVETNSQQENRLMVAHHAPTFSVASMQKDKYTLEDYVQYAQNQIMFEQGGESQKLCREMFLRLQIAKSASIQFSDWKEKLLNNHLGKALDELHGAHLLKQYFAQLRKVKVIKKERAEEFHKTWQLRSKYVLFGRWQDANYQLIIKDRKVVKRFRMKFIFKHWVDYMSLQSNYMVMILQAMRYQSQALTSKALLTLYTHTVRQRKVRKQRLKHAFRKYFKAKWTDAYYKSRALRKILTRVHQKDEEWERTRYQREFTIILECFGLWKLQAAQHKSLKNQFIALSHYKNTLILKSFGKWSQLVRINKAFSILDNQVKLAIVPCFESLCRYSLKHEIMKRDWQSHRQRYFINQMLVQWREYTVKQKLARMMVKKRYLTKFKAYVHQKTRIIPEEFWSRYRQIVFFKALEHIKDKNKRRAVVVNKKNNSLSQYYQKLKKKALIALLQNIFQRKKKQILKATVHDFRVHHLKERVFKLMKIGSLNLKKEKILNQVAYEFREDRLMSRTAFLNDGNTIETKTIDDSRDQRVLLQKVYTAWLQYTLESFIKNKVLNRYMTYSRSKQMTKVFKAWRAQIVKDIYIDNVQETERMATPATTGMLNMTPSEMFVESSQKRPISILKNSQGDLHSNNNLRSTASLTQVGRQFVQTTEPKRKQHMVSHEKLPSNGFDGTSYAYSYEQTTPGQGTSAKKSLKTGGAKGFEVHEPAHVHSHTLFNELEAIFNKNKQWMQEQKDRETVIKQLADQYQDKLLLHSTSQLSRSNLNDSVSEELAKMRERKQYLLQGQSILSSSNNASPIRKDQQFFYKNDNSIEDINEYLKTEEELMQLSRSPQVMRTPITASNGFGMSQPRDSHNHGATFSRTKLSNYNNNVGNDTSMYLGQMGLISGTTSNDQLVYSGQTGALNANDITGNTEEQIMARQTQFRAQHGLDKSDLSISSFSNLAKDLNN